MHFSPEILIQLRIDMRFSHALQMKLRRLRNRNKREKANCTSVCVYFNEVGSQDCPCFSGNSPSPITLGEYRTRFDNNILI